MRKELVLSLLPLQLAACEQYRIEYRDRPTYVEAATGQPLPDERMLADGTKIVYRDPGSPGVMKEKSSGTESEPFKIREEDEDGEIVLKCFLPEHVLANALTCLINEEYELFWDQIVAEQARVSYVSGGLGPKDFQRFLRKHRRELVATLNRMLQGLPRHEVVTDDMGDGVMRLRFHPVIGKQFKYRTVLLTNEKFALKLLRIE